MLVTFKTSVYSDITMFGTAAISLLKLMGQSGNVPGAILAADVPQALQTLQAGLAELSLNHTGDDSAKASEAPSGYEDEDDAVPVALHTRAGPLISLLEAAVASKENVQWDK